MCLQCFKAAKPTSFFLQTKCQISKTKTSQNLHRCLCVSSALRLQSQYHYPCKPNVRYPKKKKNTIQNFAHNFWNICTDASFRFLTKQHGILLLVYWYLITWFALQNFNTSHVGRVKNLLSISLIYQFYTWAIYKPGYKTYHLCSAAKSSRSNSNRTYLQYASGSMIKQDDPTCYIHNQTVSYVLVFLNSRTVYNMHHTK